MTAVRKPAPAQPDSANIRVAPGAYFLGGLLAGFGCELLVGSIPALPATLRPVGVALIVCGLAIGGVGLFSLYRARTAIDPMKRSTALVTGGVYRVTRNPAYLGLTLTYTGVALAGRSTVSLLLLPVVVVLLSAFVIRREEAYLSAVFGTAYDEYRSRVRRWL